MFGQIISQENCEATKIQIGKKYPAFSHTIDRIPVKSVEELGAAATILQAITSYVMTNRWVAPSKSEFIREIDRYIEEHLGQSITVEDICLAFRVGRTKLYEISMDYLGCGLAEYIRRQRIAYAQKMLTGTDMPITDIAFAVGFSDYNHFSRVFKQVAGITARECRKQAEQP
jgi:AraC-like DNA-binding protein